MCILVSTGCAINNKQRLSYSQREDVKALARTLDQLTPIDTSVEVISSLSVMTEEIACIINSTIGTSSYPTFKRFLGINGELSNKDRISETMAIESYFKDNKMVVAVSDFIASGALISAFGAINVYPIDVGQAWLYDFRDPQKTLLIV